MFVNLIFPLFCLDQTLHSSLLHFILHVKITSEFLCDLPRLEEGSPSSFSEFNLAFTFFPKVVGLR